MSDMETPLPDFDNPPVVEVALSVQFETLSKLQTPQLGLLWREFRERFPLTEDHAPLNAVIEQFGGPETAKVQARFEMLPSPPPPRCWFLNEAGTELVQVQQDRFVHNWRKAGTDAEYPRWEYVQKAFANELERFRAFLEREHLGSMNPNQCEVTYVNHIVAGQGWKNHGELGEVLTVFEQRHSDSFLSPSKDVHIRLNHTMENTAGEPLGRLHVLVQPGFRKDDDQPMWLLNLTARGRPGKEDVDGVLQFMDMGREWVVRGFASMTTEKMHKIWGRRNGS